MKTQKTTKQLATLYLFIITLSSNAQTAFFEGIGHLYENPDPFYTYSQAYAVSDNGKVVGYSSSSINNNPIVEAYLWEDGNLQSLGALGDPNDPFTYWSIAGDISNEGNVVVGYSFSENCSEFDPFPAEAMKWTSGGGMEGIGGLSQGDYQSEATATSYDGSVIVGRSLAIAEAFRWENGVMTSLAPGVGSEAWGVSADGTTVVGTAEFTDGQQGFIWTETTGMVGIGAPAGNGGYSVALNVSADGTHLVGFQFEPTIENFIAFRWTQGEGRISIGDLPGGEISSSAYAISNDGNIIVGRSHSELEFEAFLWRESSGMMRLKEVLENEYNLDLTGWQLKNATDISGDGTYIVGNGINPEGIQEAWVAYLPNLLDINQHNEISFKLYPNPTTGIINIQTEEDIENIAVYTINGSKLPVQLPETGKAIDISNLSTGVYFVRITANNQSQTYKIIKE